MMREHLPSTDPLRANRAWSRKLCFRAKSEIVGLMTQSWRFFARTVSKPPAISFSDTQIHTPVKVCHNGGLLLLAKSP